MMKPNDVFKYHTGLTPSYNLASLSRLYQPIIGLEGLALYGYLLAFSDNGRQKHTFSEVLNYLSIGMPAVENALALLTAVNLVDFAQTSEGYVIELKAALSQEYFLANPAYRSLLEKRVGEPAVKMLETALPPTAHRLSKTFSEMFDDRGDLATQPQVTAIFDFDSFQRLMHQKGYQFKAETEQEDIIALYRIAESQKLNWYDLFQLAEATATRHVISPKRIQAKLGQNQQKLADVQFSKEEMVILDLARKYSPFEVLAICRRKYKGYRRDEQEENCLRQLRSDGFLDEVINVMVYYTFARTKSANLNIKYINKLANDFVQVTSAEMAVERLRSFDQKKTGTGQQKTRQTNIPEWSDPDYKNETSTDEKRKLEEMKQQMLSKLRKD